MDKNETTETTGTGEQLPLPFDPPLDEAAKAETGEIDALRTENDQLRSALRLRDARESVTSELSQAGARSPELLFEAARDSLQFDAEGRLVNAAAVVGDLKRRFPEQFGAVAQHAAVDAGAGTSRQPGGLSRNVLAKMSPAEIARLDWADVRQVLTN